jgi:hypothetical protein
MSMATNTAAIHVGRLLEVRADRGYGGVSDVDALFDAMDTEIARRPASQRMVVVADWHLCPVVSPIAAERMLQRMIRLNPRIERSGALTSASAPVSVAQFLRLVRESGLPDRRLFSHPEELADWLQEVLTPAETQRLQEFLGMSAGQARAPSGASH